MRLQLAVLFLLAIGTQALAPDVFAAEADDARRYMNRGKAAMKEAKNAEDFTAAAKEFDASAAAAPKMPEARYNAGVAYEKAGDYATAMARFRSYLELVPKAKDAQAVKDHIDELEFKAEKASDLSGCWQEDNWKGNETMVRTYGADWCEFVIEKGAGGVFIVKPFKVQHTLHGSGNAPPLRLAYSVLDAKVEGRKVRFQLRARDESHEPNTFIYDYELAASPDGQALAGTVRARNAFFNMDNSRKVRLVRVGASERR